MEFSKLIVIAACLATAGTVNYGETYMTLFWDLYGAVSRGTRILSDVVDGVGAVSKAIRAIDKLLDATESEESTKTPLQITDASLKDSPTPVFSGCGALGFHIRDPNIPMSSLTGCCDKLDVCYSSSCATVKWDCDSAFKNCLYAVCDTAKYDKSFLSNCKGAAKLLFSGTIALSFQQFTDAQDKLGCSIKQKKKKK